MIIAAVIYSWLHRSSFLELPVHTRNKSIFYFFLWIDIWDGVVVEILHLILHVHSTELAEVILVRQSQLWLLKNVLQHRL